MENYSGDIDEKRAYKRVPVDAQAECEVFSAEPQLISMNREKARYNFRVENICLGGLQLITDRMLPKESILRVKVIFNGIPETICAYTQVRWCSFDGDIKGYRAGLEFFYLKDNYKNICTRIIERSGN